MAASQVVPNTSEPFPELWAVLGKAQSPPAERASAYRALAGCLKGDVSPEFMNALTNQYKKIITLVMDDIAAPVCTQEAIQLLGYCLFTPQFAEACGDEAGRIIGALCSVQYKKPTEKSILTRALWCLSSQNFHSYQICHSVPQVVTLATEVILEHGFGSLAVESLNVFRRIHQQCPKEFGLVVSMWYKGIIVLLYCKVAKFQRKAHGFATTFESSIASNSYLVGYLCKELKERVIAALLGYMEERGKDPILIMNIWSHFVTVIGNSLHKHSSFLNEMLRVVEMGFKHKVFLVQVGAYSAWRVLINNFSLDMERLTQQRRLKLLLMPLLASAVKDKHEQVETARLFTWWHLIRKLGSHREILFHQVCIPFLLFCLGVDPKLDTSKLPSVLGDLGSWTPPSLPPPPDRGGTNLNKENLPASRCPTGQGKTPTSGQGFSGRAGRLLTLLGSSSPGKRSDRLYQNTPKLGLVMSGCQAVLQFVGCNDILHGSSLDTNGGVCEVYQKNAVPLDVIQFLTVFLDGALLYMVHYAKEVKENSVESLIKSLFPVFLGTIKRECVTDAKSACHLVAVLTSMLKWEAIAFNVSSFTRMELLSQLIALPPPLTSIITTTYGPVYWCSVAHELIDLAPAEHNHPRFQRSWGKLVELSTAVSGGPANGLSPFPELTSLLDRFVTTFDPDSPRKQQPSVCLHRMWTSLGQRFIGVVKETSQVNEGTALDPNFSTARRILKFPFLHRIFYNAEKLVMNVTFETWKEVYDIFCILCSLVVKDPNHCAELVCKDIYDSYGQNVRGNSATLDKAETICFDSYQNTVGQALTHTLSNFNWIHLRSSVQREGVGGRGAGERGGKGGRENAVKTIQPLISVLSWQLATLWDTVQRSPVHIEQLSSPYTLMETVTLLYSHLPSRDLIHTTTEMLAQPMVTLWQNVLESETKVPTVSHKSLHKWPFDLPERIVKAWRAVLACVQSRYAAPFTSDLLSALSPLLVLCLSCKRQDVVNETLSFWMATFDTAPEPLVYPNKLRDVFVKCRKKWDLQLTLPGFEVTSGSVAHSTTVEDSFPHSDLPRHPPSQSPPSDGPGPCNKGVVLPHPSPQRGIRGSFLGGKRSPCPGVVTTPPGSPAAQDMEEILARSRGHGGRGGAGVGKSPVLSARRRLSLNSDKSDEYVLVEPPAKRQQLLTEHQREKMRERRESIPVMYNALDPSQDPSQSTAHHSIPDSAPEEPIIIPESEGSPPTTVTTSRSVLTTSSAHRPLTTSLIQGSSSSSIRPQAHFQSFTHHLAAPPISSSAPTSQVAPSTMTIETSSGAQMGAGMPQGHVRKSPISSRTRSRVTDPLENGPLGYSTAPPSYYSVTRPYVPGSGVGGIRPVRVAYHPSSHHQLSPTSITPPFSPTDLHYQTLHGGPGFPASVEPQPMYQVIQSSSGHSLMLPVSHHQPLFTEASTSGSQFVPVMSVAPASRVPSHQQQQGCGPTFPPARYIIRSNPPPPYSLHSAPEPCLSSTPPLPLSAVVRPDLSAARRAHKQRSSSLSTQTSLPSTSVAPQTTVSGSDVLMRGSVDAPIVIEDVEEPLPIVTESGRTELRQNSPPSVVSSVVESKGEGCVRENQIVMTNEQGQSLLKEGKLSVLASETNEQGKSSLSEGKSSVVSSATNEQGRSSLAEEESPTAEAMDQAQSDNISPETTGATAVCDKATTCQEVLESGQVEYDSPPSCGKVEEEDMEVVCGETESERGSSEGTALLIIVKTPEKLSSSDTLLPINIERFDSKSSTTESTSERTSVETIEEESVAVAQSLEPDSSLSESCEPGPALLEPSTVVSSSLEEAPGNLETDEPASDTGDLGELVTNERGDPAVCEVNEAAVIEESAEAKNEASPTTSKYLTQTQPESQETIGKDGHKDVAVSVVPVEVKVSEEHSGEFEGKSDKKAAGEEIKVDKEGGMSRGETAVSVSAEENQSQSEKEEDKNESAAVVEEGNRTTAPSESPVRTLQENPASVQVTPTSTTSNRAVVAEGHAASPRMTPGGILKHISQFDTPTSTAGRGRRVQFASSPVVFQPTRSEEEGFRTPRHSRSKSALTSRRILLKPDSNTKSSHNQKAQRAGSEPVYPSLADCGSPVENILPVLSPCRFTHGLVHLVHARNIRTVGNISSLTEHEVQTLPIKSPKVENLRQALRNFQQQHMGTKRRASMDSDSLGPPAKKRSRETSPEEVGGGGGGGGGEINREPPPPPLPEKNKLLEPSLEEAVREDGDSQLSLIPSQASQSEPAVVLSSPDHKNSDGVETAENEKRELLQSVEEMNDDDDNVFVEESQSIVESQNIATGSDSQHVTDISTIEYRNEGDVEEEEDTIETGSALVTTCPSPPLGVGSPEIPLQSSPSGSPVGGSIDELAKEEKSGGSVRDSLSSDSDSEGEREEGMELGEATTCAASAGSVPSSEIATDAASLVPSSEMECNTEIEAASVPLSLSDGSHQQSTCFQHDHSYFSSTREVVDTQSTAERRDIVVVASAAQLADHDYCSGATPGSSLEGDEPQPSAPPPPPFFESSSNSDTELRSMLSSDIQDHNYCRQLVLNPPGATPDERSSEPVSVRDIVQKSVATDEPCNMASQELFSQGDDRVPNPSEEHPLSLPVLSDVGCQTVTQKQSTSSPLPSDGDIESSLRTYVDGVLGRDDLPVPTLWKLHQQLMCCLFKVSEKLRAENS